MLDGKKIPQISVDLDLHGFCIMPERRLVLAVLVRAYLDFYDFKKLAALKKGDYYKGYKVRQIKLYASQFRVIKNWFLSDKVCPYSFVWCAQSLVSNWENLVCQFRLAIERSEKVDCHLSSFSKVEYKKRKEYKKKAA